MYTYRLQITVIDAGTQTQMDSSHSQLPDEEGLNLNEWEQIQFPSREGDMVTLRDNYLQHTLSLFHPSQHQDLPLSSSPDEQPNSPPSPPSSLSSSRSDGLPTDGTSSGSSPRVVNDFGRQLSLRFKILGSGIVRIAVKLRCYVGGFWSFVAMTGAVAAMLLWLLYARVHRWRRRTVRQVENNNRLIFLIKEKDQKINQLLLQVSQMNESISARRKVPVLRIR